MIVGTDSTDSTTPAAVQVVEASAPAQTVAADPARPRVSPLDPRLPKFAAEHDLLQGHVAEFKRLAAELGVRVHVVVEVDWR